MRPAFVAALLMIGMPAPPVAAQDRLVIYRCTDASGAVTLQNNRPCPKGSQQQRRVMEAAPSAPPASTPAAVPVAPVAPAPPRAPPPAPAPAPPDPVVADEDRLPPPALYECRTYNGDRYLTEDATPQRRCAALATTGLGGLQTGGVGQACEMKTDQCQRVPDGALCDSWRQRLREAESARHFGSGDPAKAEGEVERVGRVVRESTCGP